MAKPTRKPVTAETAVLDHLRVGTGRRKRRLTGPEASALLQMFAVKETTPIAPEDLAPAGSFLARMLRHFDETDISHALPLMQVVMIAASWLTQSGACLDVPGVGSVRPTLWSVVLAGSGTSKTFAKDELFRILADDGRPPVAMMPTGSTDAQWIEDLRDHNGAFWLQDETGKFFQQILMQSNYVRMKHWMLDCYSHQPISNRLKSAETKTTVEDPHFTYLGLGVADTWHMEVDLTSMLDGFCQRFNLVIAPPRADTDMFDHFLYFAGEDADRRRAALGEIWRALCAQPGAAGEYRLGPDVLPFLEAWWRDLRTAWGNTPLPGSFIRRIGFSVLRYLVVLQFLLGKSRWPIDVETADLATRYAELHFRSALAMLRQYSHSTATAVAKVASLREQLLAQDKPATRREISRRLSKAQRTEITPNLIEAVLEVLNRVEDISGLIVPDMEPKQKWAVLVKHRDAIQARLRLNERKRNERRLRNLLASWRAAPGARTGCDDIPLQAEVPSGTGNVVALQPIRPARVAGTDG